MILLCCWRESHPLTQLFQPTHEQTGRQPTADGEGRTRTNKICIIVLICAVKYRIYGSLQRLHIFKSYMHRGTSVVWILYSVHLAAIEQFRRHPLFATFSTYELISLSIGFAAAASELCH